MTQPLDGLTLTEQTTRRLHANGIPWDDPGLQAIRAWNAAVYARAGLPDPHPEGTPDGS
jgi:hypothetical protein